MQYAQVSLKYGEQSHCVDVFRIRSPLFVGKNPPWVLWEQIILASRISPTLFRSHLVTSFTRLPNLQWVNVSILSSTRDQWNGVLDFAPTCSRSKLWEGKQESLVQLQPGSQRWNFFLNIYCRLKMICTQKSLATHRTIWNIFLPSLTFTRTFSDLNEWNIEEAMGRFFGGCSITAMLQLNQHFDAAMEGLFGGVMLQFEEKNFLMLRW